MVLGHREAISKATREAYSRSGASHVLALSGLHIGIIFSLFLLVFRRNALGIFLSIIAAWAFALFVGLPSSAIRSAVMLTIYALSTLSNEENQGLNSLALAALVVLLPQPMMLWDISFQLSFMAVAGILIAYKPLFYAVYPTNCLLRWAWGMICISLSAQMLTFPLLLHYFGSFATYFLLTNFIVIPAATAILYLALLAFVSMLIPALQTWIINLMTMIAGWMNTAVTTISHLPYAAINSGKISISQTICIYIAVFSLMRIYYIISERHPLLH